jgi:hypothetical protein
LGSLHCTFFKIIFKNFIISLYCVKWNWIFLYISKETKIFNKKKREQICCTYIVEKQNIYHLKNPHFVCIWNLQIIQTFFKEPQSSFLKMNIFKFPILIEMKSNKLKSSGNVFLNSLKHVTNSCFFYLMLEFFSLIVVNQNTKRKLIGIDCAVSTFGKFTKTTRTSSNESKNSSITKTTYLTFLLSSVSVSIKIFLKQDSLWKFLNWGFRNIRTWQYKCSFFISFMILCYDMNIDTFRQLFILL